jgi:hypothetical protein
MLVATAAPHLSITEVSPRKSFHHLAFVDARQLLNKGLSDLGCVGLTWDFCDQYRFGIVSKKSTRRD